MTVENDFLPFATAGGANVLTQAQYLALTQLSTGYQSGVAQSAALNKTWRQSSIMSAVLAQFIVNSSGQPAIDDGTTATLLANLTEAISAQSEALIGSSRNLSMSVATASATATLTADEIVVGSALGGLKYTLASFSKTINLATTGAGGMDTGAAPASGYVALYAIYNPTTGASALLATNATAAAQPNVYGGANMPSGYTASALVSVWPTNASSQFGAGYWRDRTFNFVNTTMFTSTVATGSVTSFTPLSVATLVPKNAATITGALNASNTVAANMAFAIGAGTLGFGAQQTYFVSSSGGGGSIVSYKDVPLSSAQTIHYGSTNSAGSPTFTMAISAYSI